MRRTYISVTSVFKTDGLMLLRSFRWTDGKTYKIDHVSEIKQGFSMKHGRLEDRYTVWVEGRQSNLYFERSNAITGNNIGRWFIESDYVE